YSEHLYCPYDDVSFEELEPRSFSFNSPFGARALLTARAAELVLVECADVADPDDLDTPADLARWSAG
ncbi:hypothetical protein AB0E96_40265, partial [Kitasatospora sp. NPDC036755]|uniref:hypothetical protein n=1 Tax=Kitasatospora sp. NPDC036755 TaxID=3154600 RepID=UPI00340B06E2